MGAGSRRSYVRFERQSLAPDGYGGFAVTWVPHWEGPVEIERQRSFRAMAERVTAGGVGSNPVVRIHVPWDDETAELTRTGHAMRAIDLDSEIHMNVNLAQDMDGRRKSIVVIATENAP